MSDKPDSVSIAYDKTWRQRYAQRSESDLIRAEKVIVSNDQQVLKIGSDIDFNEATGEFCGLMHLDVKSVRWIAENSKHIKVLFVSSS